MLIELLRLLLVIVLMTFTYRLGLRKGYALRDQVEEWRRAADAGRAEALRRSDAATLRVRRRPWHRGPI